MAEALRLPETGGGQFTVAAYNIENYLTMERWEDGGRLRSQPKPDNEVAALLRVLAHIDPDILMVSEVGTREDFDDLRRRLDDAGVYFEDAAFLEAADDSRRLGLLSRFPIIERRSRSRLAYTLNGRRMYMQRGILDCTMQIDADYRLRLLGVHLKSKRPTPEGEALMRRNEAHLLRRHIDAILDAAPDVNLLVCGDFNDTRNEPPVEEIVGARGSPGYMADIWLEDGLGDRWTHYWRSADVYSRFDYILASRGLFPEIDRDRSFVYRSLDMLEASDHRPVVVFIQADDR